MPNTGQPLELTAKDAVEDRSPTGQNLSTTGQKFALKWPQRDPEDTQALALLARTWPSLPPAIRQGIIALVKARGHGDDLRQ